MTRVMGEPATKSGRIETDNHKKSFCVVDKKVTLNSVKALHLTRIAQDVSEAKTIPQRIIMTG